jgi:hypothetical protein
MLFYITGGAPQAVPGTACVESNWTACIEVYCSSGVVKPVVGGKGRETVVSSAGAQKTSFEAVPATAAVRALRRDSSWRMAHPPCPCCPSS